MAGATPAEDRSRRSFERQDRASTNLETVLLCSISASQSSAWPPYKKAIFSWPELSSGEKSWVCSFMTSSRTSLMSSSVRCLASAAKSSTTYWSRSQSISPPDSKRSNLQRTHGLSQMSYCLLLLLQAHGNTGARGRQMPIKHVAGTHHHQGDGVDHQQHWGVTRKAPQEGAGPVSHPRPSGNHSPASSCNNDARADAGAGRQKLGQQLLDFRVALKRLHHCVAFANFLEAVVYLPSALRIANIASHFSPLSRRLAVLFFRARIPMHASRKERKRVSKSDGHMVCFLC